MSSDTPARSGVASSLEVDEDLVFQRRQWAFQRVARWIMLLIVCGALLGLFGPGPLSRTTLTDPAGVLSVQYNRFENESSMTELRIGVDGSQRQDGQVRIAFGRDYIADLAVAEFSPPPVSVEQAGDRQVYTFESRAADRFELRVRYEHKSWGRTSGTIGLVGGAEVRLSQVVYP